jgi:uncharacterized repeat protein (TIGR01451 family)
MPEPTPAERRPTPVLPTSIASDYEVEVIPESEAVEEDEAPATPLTPSAREAAPATLPPPTSVRPMPTPAMPVPEAIEEDEPTVAAPPVASPFAEPAATSPRVPRFDAQPTVAPLAMPEIEPVEEEPAEPIAAQPPVAEPAPMARQPEPSFDPFARPRPAAAPIMSEPEPQPTRAPQPIAAPIAQDPIEQEQPLPPARSLRDEPITRPTTQITATPQPSPMVSTQPPAQPTAGANTRVGSGRPGSEEINGIQEARVQIERRAPVEVQVGQPMIVELVVANKGSTAAEQIELYEDIPQGTQLIEATPQPTRQNGGSLSWQLGTLPAGGETIVRLQLMPTGEGEVGSVARVVYATAATSVTKVTQPRIEVAVVAPNSVMIDDEVPLAIKVSNTGSGKATGVVLRETIPEGLRHPAGDELEYVIGDLMPGQAREVTLKLKAVQAGRIVNELTVLGEGNLEPQVAQTAIDVLAPALQVAVVGPRRRFLERKAQFTLAINNPGTAAAAGVEIRAILPEGFDFVQADSQGSYNPADRSIRWMLDELPAQRGGEVGMTLMPTQQGELVLNIVATAERDLAAQAQHQTSVEGVAAPMFTVVDRADPIGLGEETRYEIRLVNEGTKASSNLRLAVELPPELELVGIDGPGEHRQQQGRLLFEPLGHLAPKAESVYHIRVRGVRPGDARFRVQLITDEMSTPVTKEESTRVYADE